MRSALMSDLWHIKMKLKSGRRSIRRAYAEAEEEKRSNSLNFGNEE
jgi:hypothetical protein